MPEKELQSSELCAALNISPRDLKNLREGADEDDPFPYRKFKNRLLYTPTEVAEWLIRNGKAVKDDTVREDVGPVFTTRKEVAHYFGVGTRTVAMWIEDPSFPAKSGGKGHANKGHFPAAAIARWLRSTGKYTDIPAELLAHIEEPQGDVGGKPATQLLNAAPKDRLTELRADKAELELHRLQGQMIDAEEALRFYQRTNSYAVTTLKAMPSRLQANLPSDTDESVRIAVDKAARAVVKECMECVAELIEGDKDED